ncbi:MAG: GntR family histidine utilization transcriptional repressor [Arenicella sp.]|jgi:GntR family histidine utilization transcriptional repressor
MTKTISSPYQKVKKSMLDKIISGELKVSERVPSDSALAKIYGVSRITANKAMCELADEGYVERMTGVGTFVAENRSHGDFLRVTNIAEEVSDRSHTYDNEIVELNRVAVTEEISKKLHLPLGFDVFHSVIVHRDQGTPIQLEDRYVNPLVAPDFMEADFSVITPTAYLMNISPPHEVEQKIEAVIPSKEISKLLSMGSGEPCLLVNRRTWIRGAVATYVFLYHPGSRYDLSSRWTPQ